MENNRDFKKEWEELQIKNDFLFSKVMRDKEICIALLERLLKISIKDIEYLEEEKTIDLKYSAKSVRLDVYAEEKSRAFNLEMQTTMKKELPYRSRYYQGMIDLNSIEKGAKYKELKESYVIFICTFDPFGAGRAQYTFENLCVEDAAIRLQDGTKRIFFNATDYYNAEDEDVREFLRYVNGEKSDNPFVQIIESKVAKVKANREWRREYMTLLTWEQDIRDEAIEEGRKEGRKEDIKILVSMLQSLQISNQVIMEQLMEKFELTEEQVRDFLS